jgi:hypothetical protein
MDGTQLPPSVEDDPGDVTGSPRPELLWTKLVAPAPRAGLQSLLQSSLQAKLCLVGAPAGSGKTTLLAQWRAVAGGGRVAWVSLEESDNDPTRFWSYLVAALRTVEPGVGTVALEALGGPSVELERVVRSLVNDLATVGASLVLVLDDYQLITEAICHQTLGWFLDQLPPAVHVVLSTRVDPPLPLALERQPEELRVFLLRTSVLERLSGPLCDAVLEAQGSAELLRELEASNLFVVPLDDRRQWYRYHQLFADLLRLQLGVREPGLVPVLHRRAAAWHRQAGNIDEAIHHASAAGDFAEAGVLMPGTGPPTGSADNERPWPAGWTGCRRRRSRPIPRWPSSPLGARGFQGASKQDTERWLAAAEDPSYGGPPPDGMSSQAFGAALALATLVFDDVGRSAAAARRALELAGDQPAESSWAGSALGQTLYLSGRSAEARPRLEDLVSQAPATVQPYPVVTALAVLSLIAADQDDPAAASLARRAVATANAQGVSFEPLSGIVYLALGRALARQGGLPRPRSSWSGHWRCSTSTPWPCTAGWRCWRWRLCVTVGAICQALGRWSTRPAA